MGDVDAQLNQLIALRHRLHRTPELSGQEAGTAQVIREFLEKCRPDEIHTELGGHGLAAVFKSSDSSGPSIMLRAELDALPLKETISLPWASEFENCAHKCGHDGHMAILAGVALRLKERPPASGSVTLLFQPAEETGYGAAALLDDSRFQALKPHWIFALHNLPGHEVWSILTRDGAFAAGSAGVRIKLQGATSHAAYPEQGNSPDLAMAEIVTQLAGLNDTRAGSLALVTVVHARLGEKTFGISPGEAEILATIRSDNDLVLNKLKNTASDLGKAAAQRHNLTATIEFCEEFPVTMNHPEAVAVIKQTAAELDLDMESPEESPFRWSEDFGLLTSWVKRGAMFGLGAGVNHPVLHGPDYDFNDDLILPGVTIMDRICRTIITV